MMMMKLKKNYATKLMNKSRCKFYKSFTGETSSDQRKPFAAMKTLLYHTHEVPYPPFKDKLTFGNEMSCYFKENIKLNLITWLLDCLLFHHPATAAYVHEA